MNLRRALQETQKINKALGILMGHFQFTEEEAYRTMITNSTAQRTKVSALAERLIQTFERTTQCPAEGKQFSSLIEKALGGSVTHS